MGSIPAMVRHRVEAAAGSAGPSAGPPSVHPGVLIAALAAAGISVSLMQTLVIPLIPELPRLLGTGPANASWAITATLLTGAVATPVFGRLGDMYGPKPILILCAVALTAGSLVAALTSSLAPLVIGRGLQGVGMPIIPLGISVLRASLPAQRVGTAMGLMSASLGVGGALGMPLSAVIAEHFDWHALFWFATALGAASGLLFLLLVPAIPAGSTDDRFDALGTLGLAAALVTLLLPITKGASWGWTSPTTVGLFAASMVLFAVFGAWQLRTTSPIVDLRTTLRRPVLATNLASIAIGFALFAMSLIGPQILELPTQAGHGLGQSMLAAGLWMAPSGLAMMVSALIAARVAAVRGPRFTLLIGGVVVACGYLGGVWLLASPGGVLTFSVIVSVGVGFAFASLPALINAAVPVSETAAANGINALARSLGTSTSSAVMSAVLAGMSVDVAGHLLPSLSGFKTALLIAAGAAVAAVLLALVIPARLGVAEAAPASLQPPEPRPAEQSVHRLEAALAMLGRHTAIGPYADGALPPPWLPRGAYLLMSCIDEGGASSVAELAAAVRVDPAVIDGQLRDLYRNGLITEVGGRGARFVLTAAGRERVYRQRAHKVAGLRWAVHGWSGADVEELAGYLHRLNVGIDRHRRHPGVEPVTTPLPNAAVTARIGPSHSWSGSARR